jgi:hypothetical protein
MSWRRAGGDAGALALTIATPVSNLTETYGRVAGGFNVQVAQNVCSILREKQRSAAARITDR